MIKRSVKLLALVLALVPATGCFMSPRTANELGRMAFVTAVVAANVAILASHDAHYHGYGCGHQHRYRDGRWVYYYEDRWEYHEQGRWYYYAN
jgi:hypothetical protein